MRVRGVVVCVVVLVLAASAANALLWKDVNWGSYNAAPLSVNAYDELVVRAGSEYTAAHYNTPSEFRGAATPWIEVAFFDPTPGGPRSQLWVEKEGQPGAAWFQFGSWNESSFPTYQQYGLYLWNVDLDTDSWVWFGGRVAGQHTLKVGMRADKTVDFWLDGALRHSTQEIAPSFFGDIYLGSRFGDSTFAGYRTGVDYEGPAAVPEPTSLVLLALACIGAVSVVKLKRK